MRAGLALLVLILNVLALVSILGARAATGRKLAWVAAVVLLPAAGALAWLLAGRRRRAAGRRGA
jgi:hypothetical protein